MSSNYFGEPWPSGVCEDGTRHDTPVGKKCLWCGEPIVEGDRGTFMIANPDIPECMDEDHLVFVFTVLHSEHMDELGVAGARSYGMNPTHRECMYREVMGGIGHHENHVRWCLGEHDPDGGRTRRQSALEVWDYLTGRIPDADVLRSARHPHHRKRAP